MHARGSFVPRAGETYVFVRPVSRLIFDLVGLPLAAAAFLVGASLMLTGVLVPDSVDPLTAVLARFVAPLFFGFFGLLMASGIRTMLRRGLHRIMLKVGPAGIWIPEMGSLSWDEIASVRLEAVPGFSGRHVSSAPRAPTIYRRLGIVPRDVARGAEIRSGLTWRMLGWMQDVTRVVSPRARIKNVEDLAPFGVFAYEITESLDDAVAAIRQYREVTIEEAPSPDTSPQPEPGGIGSVGDRRG